MSSINFNDPEMQEIFEGFLVETQELIDSFSQDLMQMESDSGDPDLLNRIFRSIHTIKGTSSFMGFDSISTIAHHAEDVLNKLRRGELSVNQSIVDVLLEVNDWILRLVESLKQGNNETVDYSKTIRVLELVKENKSANIESEEISGNEIKSSNLAKSQADKDFSSPLDAVLNNKEMVSKPGDFTDDELALIEAAFAEVNKNFFSAAESSVSSNFESETNIDANSEENKNSYLNETENLGAEQEHIESIKQESIPKTADKSPKQQEHASLTAKHQQNKAVTSETIRIDVQRVEALMDLSGELVLGRNRLMQIAQYLENEIEKKERAVELLETAAQIDFITSEIQSAVMKMRMIPIAKLYQKAPRIVRDLSKEFGKKINLILKGEETEIDRGIIEELNDPLVHMIRNSCDHGIEAPEDRLKVGKEPEGTITLDAYQEGNNIVMKIMDDGKGMDPEKLKLKAIEKGLVTEAESQLLTKRDILQFIFLPGFSTAAKVSSVSGRGVGMDVVRTNIQNLKGLIDIESEIGKGSTFTIKLPLTLAIIQGLLVRIQNEKYAIPLASVVEVVAIDQEKVYSVREKEVIRIREDVLPLVRLDKVLKSKIAVDALASRYVVVVGVGVQRVGFVVDELLGQQEIVIKSLGEYLGHVTGVAGSTILGDGSVIMIVDVPELVIQASN